MSGKTFQGFHQTSLLLHHDALRFFTLTDLFCVRVTVLQEFIPHMAKQYGFQYELVQYKWPRWLHQQTEKQRIIWGYKILFLDVLFPLAVDKILFVDADQVRSGLFTVPLYKYFIYSL